MRRIKKTIAVVLAFGMIASGVGTGNEQVSEAKAAKKPSVVKNATVMAGQQKSLAIKATGLKIKSITVKSSDKSVLKVKAKKKTKSVILTGVEGGVSKVTTTVTVLKNKKKTKYKLTTTVIVKEVAAPGYEGIDVDYDVDTGAIAIDTTFNMAMTAIESFVPFGLGKTLASGLKTVFGDIKATNNGAKVESTTLTAINQNIEGLRDEINKGFDSIGNKIATSTDSLENTIINQSVLQTKGTKYDDLHKTLKGVADDIDGIMVSDEYCDATKALLIADLIAGAETWNGNSDNWKRKNENPIKQFTDFLDDITSSTFIETEDGKDIFQVAADMSLNRMKKDIMFSGEALNKSDGYARRVFLLATYGYSIILQCLRAHQIVSSFTEDDIKAVKADDIKWNKNFEKLLGGDDGIVSSRKRIDEKITKINQKIFKEDATDSVAAHLKSYMNLSRTTFLNKGNSSLKLKKTLRVSPIRIGTKYLEYGYDYHGNLTGYGFINFESVTSAYWDLVNGAGFSTYLDKAGIWFEVVREADDMMNYVCEKNMTLKEYLTEVGFDLSGLDDDVCLPRMSNWCNEKPSVWIRIGTNLINKHYTKINDKLRSGKNIASYEYNEVCTRPTNNPDDVELKLCMFERE